MTRFVAPLGFSSHRVTQPVIAYGTSKGDQLVLLQPEQAESSAKHRAESAVNDVKSTLSGVAPDIEVTHHVLDVDQFMNTVDQCSEILTTGEPPVACIGGGATDIHAPFIVAATAHTQQLDDVLLFKDTESAAEPISLPRLATTVPPRVEDTFEVFIDHSDPLSISDIATEAAISEGTASRHVQILQDHDIVGSDHEAKRKLVTLTPIGKLLARNNQIDRS